MDSKVVIRRFLNDNEADVDSYVSASFDDYSDQAGQPSMSIDFRIHDGHDTINLYLPVDNEETFKSSMKTLDTLYSAIDVLMKEVHVAYIDAKIRSAANAADETKSEEEPEA